MLYIFYEALGGKKKEEFVLTTFYAKSIDCLLSFFSLSLLLLQLY